MSRPYVRFRLPDGELMRFYAGEMIGRVSGPRFADPHISETHAFLTQRGGRLMLKGVGQMLFHNHAERPKPVIELAVGDTIGLLSGRKFDMVVYDFEPATHRLELELWDAADPASTLRKLGEPTAEYHAVLESGVLVEGYRPEALWNLMGAGTRWTIRPADGAADTLEDERIFRSGRWSLQAVFVPIPEAEQGATTLAQVVPVSIEVAHGQITLTPRGGEPFSIRGRPGTIFAIVCREYPAGRWLRWEDIAGEIWEDARGLTRDTPLHKRVRDRWDTTLDRLRSKLEERRVSRHLIRTRGGYGRFRLELGPTDEFIGEES